MITITDRERGVALVARLLLGHSMPCSLIAPRQMGKSYFLRLLYSHLSDSTGLRPHLIELEGCRAMSPSEVYRYAMSAVGLTPSEDRPSAAEFVTSLRGVAAEHNSRLILLFDGSDHLCEGTAAEVLVALRQLASGDNGTEAAVLVSGGLLLADWSRRPSAVSPWSAELLHLGELTARECVRLLAQTDECRLSVDAGRVIWRSTRGHPRLAQLVSSLVKQNAGCRCSALSAAACKGILRHILQAQELSNDSLIRQLIGEVEGDVRAFALYLEASGRSDRPFMPADVSRVRARTALGFKVQSGRVVYRNPVFQACLRQHFDQLRVADIAVLHGLWPTSRPFVLRQYRRVTSVRGRRLSRSLGLTYPDPWRLVFSLSHGLLSATSPIDVLRQLYDAVRHALGFRDAAVWRKTPASTYVTVLAPPGYSRRHPAGATRLMRADRELALYQKAERMGQRWFALTVESAANDTRVVLEIQVPANEQSVSPDEIEGLQRLVQAARVAYRACTTLAQRDVLIHRQVNYLNLFAQVARRIGSAKTIDEVLDRCARALQVIGYGRILISFVDWASGQITGAWGHGPYMRLLSRLTRRSLTRDANDCQCLVATSGHPLLVDNPAKDQRTHPVAATRCHLRPFAIVPIPLGRKTIATFHVERNDALPISREEVDSVQQFAHMIAATLDRFRQQSLRETIFDNLDEPAVIVDEKGIIRDANHHMQRVLGRSSRKLVGRVCHEALYGRDPSHGPCVTLLRCTEQGCSRVREARLPSCPGKVFEEHIAAIPDPASQRPVGALITLKDLSRPSIMVRRAIEMKAKLDPEHILAQMMACLTELGYRFIRRYSLEMSDTRLRLLEWHEDVERVPHSDSLNASNSPESFLVFRHRRPILFRFDSRIRGAASVRRDQFGRYVARTSRDVLRWRLRKHTVIEWLDIPLMVADRVYGKVTLDKRSHSPPVFDVEEYYDMERLCAIASLALESARLGDHGDFLSVLISQVNHSLGQPVHRILNLWEHMREGAASGAQAQAIEREINSLSKRVRQFYLAQRLIMPEQMDAAEPVTVTRLCREAIRSVKERFPRSGIRFKGCSDDKVFGQPQLLQVAVESLVENAVIHGDRGEGVDVRVSRNRDSYRVEVADLGPGIPNDKQTLVFEPFVRQNDRESANVSGLGLGLYIARKIARLHGGNVTLMSRRGQGATFRLEVPGVLPSRRSQ
jgi:PAS domain S-box-containing protein